MKQPKCRTCGQEHRIGPCPEFTKSRGSVESKVVRGGSRRPLEHASGSIPSSDGLSGKTGKDALAGIPKGVKSAQPTARNRRNPEKPETAYSTDRQVAGVASGPREPTRKGRPLAKDRPHSLAATEPWKQKGMSRSTWFRYRAEGRL